MRLRVNVLLCLRGKKLSISDSTAASCGGSIAPSHLNASLIVPLCLLKLTMNWVTLDANKTSNVSCGLFDGSISSEAVRASSRVAVTCSAIEGWTTTKLSRLQVLEVTDLRPITDASVTLIFLEKY